MDTLDFGFVLARQEEKEKVQQHEAFEDRMEAFYPPLEVLNPQAR